jgi:hypothetical protein
MAKASNNEPLSSGCAKHQAPNPTKQRVASVIKRIWNFLSDKANRVS